MRKTLVAVAVVGGVALVGCGGGKPANEPGSCPEGTVLKGADCLPATDSNEASSAGSGDDGAGGDDKPKKKAPKASDDQVPSADSSGSGVGGGTYDHDAVGAELKRAAKQINRNCGAATDDDGKATGPWGSLKASIVLGRNGHVKDVTVPDPYNGKPVGTCVSRALLKIQFPPYAAPSDASIDWDFELVKPK